MIPLKWVAVLIVFILGYREVEIITGKTLRTSRVSVVFNAVHLGGWKQCVDSFINVDS